MTFRHAYITALRGEIARVRDTHGSSYQRRVMKRPPAETISWAVNALEAAVSWAVGDWRSELLAHGMVAIQGVFTAITTMRGEAG